VEFRKQLEQLAERLLSSNLQMTREREQKLLRYATLVARRAREFNLVSKHDLGELISKHIGASLGSLLLLEPGERETWIDIGTGAGFPGMVLKIWEPGQEVLLVESSAKRCLFLEEAGQILRIKIRPVQARGQELNLAELTSSSEPRRVFITRAVDPLPRALAWLPKHLRAGDRWLLYTGPGWKKMLESQDADVTESGLEFESCLEIPWSPGRIMSFSKSGRG
jgi:16S rRNA (guanine527-N7)-methyltransferase